MVKPKSKSKSKSKSKPKPLSSGQSEASTPVVARLAAIQAIARVLDGESLMSFSAALKSTLPPNERGAYQALCFGVLRHYQSLSWVLAQLLEKPLRSRDRDLQLLLLSGVFELMHHQRPEHAVVSECVEQVARLPRRKQRPWAKGLSNAVLRRFLREREALLSQLAKQCDAVRYACPEWLVAAFERDWPESMPDVLQAQQTQAPMFLRVNSRVTEREDYRQRLREQGIASEPLAGTAQGLVLAQPQAVEALPAYAEGAFAVQDYSAQLSAQVLSPRAGERVLDACCAPGGKTAQLWDLANGELELVGVDASEQRLTRTQENLQRLAVQASLQCVDLSAADLPFEANSFDAILLDAPCSGTGVIRRHPDIKHLRRAEDIPPLVDLQSRILQRCWQLLKPGGRLLYCTCSVLEAENQQQIQHFLASTPDARIQAIELPLGQAQKLGWQVLPEAESGDGFYYALLTKTIELIE